MKTLIAIPCMDMVHTPFFMSAVGLKVSGEVEYTSTQTSLIYDARNILANKAINEGFDRILWLDSDMIFDSDLFKRLSERLDEGYESMSGLYFSRKAPIKPVVYKQVYLGINESGNFEPVTEPYFDYPKNEVFEVAGHGFGAVMMNVSLLKEVVDNFGNPFSPEPFFGEDFTFCRHVTDMGKKLWCDSSVKLGHAGYTVFNEEIYERRNGM